MRTQAQRDDNEPLGTAVVMVWIPAGQGLDPVTPEDGQDSEDPGAQRDSHLQPRAASRDAFSFPP